LASLSIIVPTRNRPVTLAATLKTIISEDILNLEIIIVDNSTNDDSYHVVEAFLDNRVVYLPPVGELSMSENWERGLQKSTGDYLTFLGDDDGVTSGALGLVSTLIDRFSPEALVWQKSEYFWPGASENAGNLYCSEEDFICEIVNASHALRQVRNFSRSYNSIICPYNSFVHKSLFEKIIHSSSSGNVFFGISPDITGAICLTYAANHFLRTNIPITINGASSQSNGMRFLRGPSDKNDLISDFEKLNFKIPKNNLLYEAPSVLFCLVDEYLRTMKELDLSTSINLKKYVRKMRSEASNSEHSDLLLRSAAHTATAIMYEQFGWKQRKSQKKNRLVSVVTPFRTNVADIVEASECLSQKLQMRNLICSTDRVPINFKNWNSIRGIRQILRLIYNRLFSTNYRIYSD
jgi:glycosyltransferase involved in cell wall biosynthesis